jgi:hypothetical protein
MTTLFLWMSYLIVLAIATLMSGIIIGTVARSKRWTEKRIRLTAKFGVFLLLILAELVRNRMHLSYLSNLPEKLGYPFIAPLAACLLLILFARLAGGVAWRISGNPTRDLI